MAPELRATADDSEAEFEAWSKAVNAGIDDVIIGEPSGMRLVCEVRSRIIQQTHNANALNDKVNDRRELLKHVCDLEDVIYDIVWDYLRIRLRTDIPGIDEDIGPGMPDTINDLIVGQKLGEGSFGVVCRLVHPRNIHVSAGEVLKMMVKSPLTNFHGIASLKRQLGVMRLLSSQMHEHPNIAQFYEVYHTETHILFRMEDGGPLDLYKRLVLREENEMPIGLQKVFSVLQQCMDGLCHMHTAVEIVHRDLKPENIIVSETSTSITVKYADFDTTQEAKPGTICRGTIGTFPFMAPEVVLERKYNPYPADIWSLAIVFLEIVCRLSILKKALSLPRPRKDISHAEKVKIEKLTMEKILTFFANASNVGMMLEKHIRQELVDIQEDVQYLFEGMLNVSATERWTAADVVEVRHQRFASLPIHDG
jgi:serine/threonine protein kinase